VYYNFDIHEPVLIIILIKVSEKVYNQKMLNFVDGCLLIGSLIYAVDHFSIKDG